MKDPTPSGNMESLVCVQNNCRRWSRKIGIRSASLVAAVALWITSRTRIDVRAVRHPGRTELIRRAAGGRSGAQSATGR
ncbi:MAG: hypothetical protein J2P25_01285 [Nocardiopsaceae bacterium]|nr:hypothetical protein [Nocardiopsaceae bacterium]